MRALGAAAWQAWRIGNERRDVTLLGVGGGREVDYAAEVKEADTRYAQFKVPDLKDEEVLVLASDPALVGRGKAIFAVALPA